MAPYESASNYRIVDTDAHYDEDLEDIAEYMDEPWRTRLLEGGEPGRNSFIPTTSGSPFLFGKIDRDPVLEYPDAPMDPDDVAEGMDFLEVDATIVISNVVLAMAAHARDVDDDRMLALTRGYTRYMLDNVVDPANGVYSTVPIPYYDVDAAVELLEEVADEPGIVAACVITEGNPPPGHHQFDPLYQAGSDLDMPFIFHTGGGGVNSYVRRGHEKMIESHTLGFVESNAAQLTSIVTRGVPEKFPDLDFVFMESGIFWVPMIMYRLDEEYLKRREEAPLLTKRPSEYVKEFYFGTQPLERSMDERYLEQIIEMMGGVDRLMYASDYPHWDYDGPNAITDRPFLSEEQKQRVLAGNAAEVFGI